MKNKVLWTFLAVAIVLGGCGYLDRQLSYSTGYSTKCVEGVKYITFVTGASVMYTRDGKVKTCD